MGKALEYARRGVRILLVLVLVVVLLRGAVSIARGSSSASVATTTQSVAQTWPDDEARAFAVEFARAYFDRDPKHPGYYEKSLTPYMDPDVVSRVVPVWEQGGEPQRAVSATVARVARLEKDRALITVAVAVQIAGRTSVRYLTVPVTKASSGGLVINDLPSFTSAPLIGNADTLETTPLSATDSGPIHETVQLFFEAYLAGDAAAVAAGPALPGAQLGALPVALKLDSITSLDLVEPAKGRTREVQAVITAKEGEIDYQLSYRLRLVKGDRWYVAAINEGK